MFRLLYWVAVLAVSLALLVGLILLLESLDVPSLNNGVASPGAKNLVDVRTALRDG